MRRKWMKLARTALALTVVWQAVLTWAGAERAEAARTGQWNWESVGAGAVDDFLAMTFDLAVHDNKPYLYYNPNAGAGVVKTWDGTAWMTVGSGSVSSDDIGDASLDIGPDGQMYVAYTSRNGFPYSAFVRKLEGADWVQLGGGGALSASDGAGYVGVVTAVYGHPAMYYQEMNGARRTLVRQFDGTAWTPAVAVSGSNSNLPDMAVSPQGQPVLIYADGTTGYYRATARIYDGAAWQTLGNDQFSIGTANNPSIRFAADGTAYATFSYGNMPDNGNAYLYKLTGGTWELLQQWEAHGVQRVALAIDPLTNAPFVAYFDRSGKAQVKQWNGAALIDTASLDGFPSVQDALQLEISENGTGYLAFRDASGYLGVVRYSRDQTPPVLLSTAPLADAEGVDANANLSLTFNEPIKSVAGHVIEICTEDGEQCQQLDAGSASVSISGAGATIDFPTSLRGVTKYRVVAEAGAFADLSDNPADEIEWTFTTGAAAPDAPTLNTVSAGDASVLVMFDAPYNGGSDILHYTVTLHPYSGGADIVEDTGGTLYFREELTNGETYDVTVTATNGAGTSAPSSLQTFMPSTTPGAPTISEVVVGNRAATVSFAPPSSDGFSPIQEYHVYAKQGGVTKRIGIGTASPITVTGLTNGQTYSFTVVAKNIRGESAESSALTGTPGAVPSAPSNVTAVGGNEGATVSFTPSASDGGYPITGYRITTIPGDGSESPISVDVDADKTSGIVTGLRNGQYYQFKVVAMNAWGTSMEAQTSAWTHLGTEPAAPTGLVASAANAMAIVAFDEPDSGGYPITKYRVTAWSGEDPAALAEGASSPIEVTGLHNGIAYTFTVEAYNEIGWSAPSDHSDSVAPIAVPDAPTNVSAAAGNATATVTFDAPANNGGSPITGYRVTAAPGGAQLELDADDERKATFTGLTNGTAYTFTVVAINANGSSAASGPSAAVTPRAPAQPAPSAGGGAAPTLSYKLNVAIGAESLGSLEVNRVEKPDGGYEDRLVLSAAFAQEAATKLKAAGRTALTLSMPAADPSKPVELHVSMPKNAVQALSSAGMALSITTSDAVVFVPAPSLQGWEQEMKLSISSIRDTEQITKLGERAGEDEAVRATAGNGKLTVLGKPIKVETNLPGGQRGITLTLPFGVTAPNGTQLADVGVYIEHDDGTTELAQGRITKLADQQAYAFDVTKFSTFAIVSIEGWADDTRSATQAPYIRGYDGGLFKPDSSLTRAELATILYKLYADKLPAMPTASTAFEDVPATHWAKGAIEGVARLGLMKGMTDGGFHPDKPLTRAEMAAIAAGLLGDVPTSKADAIDTAGHWAEASIAKAKSAGIMTGYKDGTFRPDLALSRAEAVTIINRLTGRNPATSEKPAFKDVPATHWAYGDIQTAAGTQP